MCDAVLLEACAVWLPNGRGSREGTPQLPPALAGNHPGVLKPLPSTIHPMRCARWEGVVRRTWYSIGSRSKPAGSAMRRRYATRQWFKKAPFVAKPACQNYSKYWCQHGMVLQSCFSKAGTYHAWCNHRRNEHLFCQWL